MTSVYSGGLLYEYTMESNGFGIVEVRGDTVSELPDFQTIKRQIAGTQMPSGDGGYKKNLPPSECPKESQNWQVQGVGLPTIPKPAEKYFQNGAGPGPGMRNEIGSQNTGTPSSGWSDGSEGPRFAASPSSSAPGTSTASSSTIIIVVPSTSSKALAVLTTSTTTTSSPSSTPSVTPTPSSTLSNVDSAGSKATGTTKKNGAAETTVPMAMGALSALVMLRLW
jgi:hypothetical protein